MNLFMFSGSQDQSIRVWDWDIKKGTTNCLQIGRGHERSVECVSVSPDSTRFATGGWDTMLKIWSSGKVVYYFMCANYQVLYRMSHCVLTQELLFSIKYF